MATRTMGVRFAALFAAFALTVYGAAEAQTSHDWSFYYGRAQYKRHQGDYAGAVADLNALIELMPGKSEFYNARGIVYEKSGNYKSAMADYEYALSINPGSAEAMHNIKNLNAVLAKRGNPSPVNVAPADSAPQVQSQPYSNPAAPYVSERAVYGVASAQPVQNDPYSRPGVVSFFTEQNAYGEDVSAPQVQSRPYSRPAAAPYVSEQNAYGNSASAPPSAGSSADGGAGGRTYISRNSATLSRQPDWNPAALNPATAKVFTRDPASDAQGRLQGRYFSQLQTEQRGKESDAPERKAAVDPVAEIYNKHGAALYRQGLYDEAILQFNEAIKACSNYAIAYNSRGLAFAGKGDFVSAAADFDQALRINPYYYDAQFNRAMMISVAARK
ncbi:MAG: tetratricopeptide repeat protein [Spirochaetaceae bacterium]|nr:tetratricopeptide repeat protein [Spirochaetaceae bacterium]